MTRIEELKRETAEYCAGFVLPSGVRPCAELCALYESEIASQDQEISRLQGLCWLIETARNTWWDGRQAGDKACFTSMPHDACRFSRFEDAEIVRCWLLERSGQQVLRSVQHAFVAQGETE